jgi:hypothetical protein
MNSECVASRLGMFLASLIRRVLIPLAVLQELIGRQVEATITERQVSIDSGDFVVGVLKAMRSARPCEHCRGLGVTFGRIT